MSGFREVELQLSSDLLGRDSPGLIRHLGLRGRRLGGDRGAVRPNDDEDFVRSYDLADETGLEHRFGLLSNVPESDSIADDPELVKRFSELERQLWNECKGTSADPTALFHLIQSNVISAARSDLPPKVKDG